MRINCEAISGPGPQEVTGEVAVASQEHHGVVQPGATGLPVTNCQQQTSSLGSFGGENFGNGSIPSEQQVLNFIAFKYFQAVDPTRPEELNGYLQYLKDVRKVLFVDANKGSLIITVECSSLEILEGLWNDHQSGHLNKMAQRFLVTEDILKEFGLVELKITTTIEEKEYRRCKEFFLQCSGKVKNLLINSLYDENHFYQLMASQRQIGTRT